MQLLNSSFSVNLWLLQLMPQKALRTCWRSWDYFYHLEYPWGKVLNNCKILQLSIDLVPARRLGRVRTARGIQSSADHSFPAPSCSEASVTSIRHHPKPVFPTAQQCCAPSGDISSLVTAVHDMITDSYPLSLPLLSIWSICTCNLF